MSGDAATAVAEELGRLRGLVSMLPADYCGAGNELAVVAMRRAFDQILCDELNRTIKEKT